ncbi:EcoKI restriction-modification system protein HsdS [Avibacterium gallinarum]|uniref:EcoKI restriction-modification system protein HsdS n=4 Tax=Pasteurellaceae TaxID=712 RepID=A0A379AYG3_AVIGA|nr:restriction endonuclease subunit S [Avibacterium gallinarum]SUB27422.1 EcoKI restriction-modification system protein HsdS [Avibacterium gallinarum]
MSNIPKLRFPEFTDAWEKCKLGEVGKTYTGLSGKTKEDFGHGQAKFITYMNVFGNPIASSSGVDRIEIDSRQNEVKFGDVFFTTSSETPEEVGMSSIWLENTENVYLNSFCFGYRPIKIFDPYFFAFYLRSPSIRAKIILLAQGISRYNISKTKMMEQEISIPTLPEQQKIGNLFKQLDRLITLHKRKWDDVILLKKALLQKMFPKNGSDFPEIRFPEFTDAWEKCKLGEVGKTYTGLSGKTKEDFGHGQAKFITYMNVFGNPIASSSGVDRIEIDSRQNEVKFGDVFFTTSSETPEEVGMSSIWLENTENVYLNSFCFGYRPIKIFDPYFFAFYLRSPSIRAKIILLAQGISRYNISKTKMMEQEISIPTLPEQQKIGNLFKQLDRLITLHKRQHEHYQLLKKALLQQMFV